MNDKLIEEMFYALKALVERGKREFADPEDTEIPWAEAVVKKAEAEMRALRS